MTFSKFDFLRVILIAGAGVIAGVTRLNQFNQHPEAGGLDSFLIYWRRWIVIFAMGIGAVFPWESL